MPKWLTSTKAIWLAALVTIFLLPKVPGSQLLSCQTHAQILAPDVFTPVHSDDSNVRNLWQYRTLASAPFHNLGVSNTYLLVSGGVALYWQPINIDACLNKPMVVALEVENGEEIWQFEVENLITQLFAIDGGFLIVNPVRIQFVDIDGTIVWERTVRDTELPLRSIQAVNEMNNVIVISSYQSVFYVQKTDGSVMRSRDLQDVLYIDVDHALVISGEHQLRLIEINDNDVIYSLNLNPSRFDRIRINSLYPRVARFDDILLLYYATEGVEAFNYQTGEPLWEISKPIFNVPVLVGDLLAMYTLENNIEVYDPVNGESVGSLDVTRSGDRSSVYSAIDPLYLIWLTSFDDILLVRDFDTMQFFAIQL